jgi:hypothetical protein
MSAFRRGTEFGRLAVAAVLLPLALPIGCQQVAPSGESITERTATPESQLENVMKRFEFALEHARTVEGAAVISERAATHRLIPPTGDRQAHEAEVTITTSMGLAPELVHEIAKENGAAAIDPVALDGSAPKDEGEKERIAEDAAENIVEKAKVSEKKMFKLRFQNDRWELVDPPADKLSDAERECFRYALSDG